jgi:exodeoxyribonuclease V alpha subunit
MDTQGEKLMETIKGELKRIYTEKGNWFSGLLKTDDEREIKIAGVSLTGIPTPDSLITLTGKTDTHPTYGEQFKFSSILILPPQNKNGILRLLESFDGVGPSRAEKIFNKFRERTIEVLTQNPEKLSEFLPLNVAKSIATQITEKTEKIEIETILCSMNLGTKTRENIHEYFKEKNLLKILKNDPYRLVEVARVSFTAVDNAIVPLKIIPVNSPARAAAAIIHSLKIIAEEGSTFAPLDLIQTTLNNLKLKHPITSDSISDGLKKAISDDAITQIIHEQPAYALTQIYMMETYCSKIIAESLKSKSKTKGDVAKIPENISSILTEEQFSSVHKIIKHNVVTLTGGPGTGKTTTLTAIIHAIGAERTQILAPTGKAAKRAAEVTGTRAMTIHRFCNAIESTDPEEIPELIVIDETSMVGVDTLFLLLETLKKNNALNKLLFVGDIDQLPSISPGNVLKDMIESSCIPIVTLTKIHRQAAESSIITAAAAINKGQIPDLKTKKDFRFIEAPENCDEPQYLRDEIVNYYRQAVKRQIDLREIQTLSPIRKGPLGTESLNAAIREVVIPNRQGWFFKDQEFIREGDRVICIANTPLLGLVNGDQGFVNSIVKDDSGRLVKSVVIDFDGIGEIELTDSQTLEIIRPAWAMTVHKSQGSQYKYIILVAHHSQFFGAQRAILYTGLTRASQYVALVGSRKGVAMAVSKNDQSKRFTLLNQLLKSQTTTTQGQK